MMKWIKLGFISIIFLIILNAQGFSATKMVGQVGGRSYNDILDQWLEEPLYVYVDSKGKTYIAGGDVFLAKAYFSDSERLEIIKLLQKGLAWSKQAREKQVELTKALGSVKFLIDELTNHYNGIDLIFFAANKAKQTDVIIKIHDFDNMFYETELYLDNDMVKELIVLLKKVPATIEKLKEEEKISEDFQ